MKRSFFLSLLVLSTALIPCRQARAVMQMMPPIQEIEVQRGRSTTFTVEIRNIGDADTPSRFVAYDMDINVWGRPEVADSTTQIDTTLVDSLAADSTVLKELWTRGCGKWITLTPAEVTVGAHLSIALTGTITAPMDAAGGYYAMIKGFFIGEEFQSEAGDKESQLFRLESQAAIVLLVTVPSSKNRAIVYPDTLLLFPEGEVDTTLLVTDAFAQAQSKAWSLILPVKNDGIIHTQVTGQVSFWTASGIRVATADIEAGKGYVLPGKVRNFRAQGTEPLADGYYMLRINLRSAEGMNATRSFPFAIYERQVYPGARTEELDGLLKEATPCFSLKQPFLMRDVTAGGSAFLAIQLQNVIEDTIKLVPRLTDWTIDEKGVASLVRDGDETVKVRSCKPWLTMEENEFIIPPGRKKSFKIEVAVPADVAGEYYSAVVFDRDSTQLNVPDEFLSSRTQLIALKTVKGVEYAVQIDSMKYDLLQDQETKMALYRFNFTVHNNSNVHVSTNGNMSLEMEKMKGMYDPVDKVRQFGTVGDNLLPDGQKTFYIEYVNLEPGKYRTVLVLNYSKDENAVIQYQTFEIN